MTNRKKFSGPPDGGFDRLAWAYDFLAALVFGHSLKTAQAHFLATIPAHSRVLLIGGGAGWLLNQMLVHRPLSRVVYVEASSRMLSLAKRKVQDLKHAPLVEFRWGNETVIGAAERFDVVITPFFLDLFTRQRLQASVMPRLAACLLPGGSWLFTDFVHPPYPFQKYLLWTMYRFFRLVCKIEAQSLPDYPPLFTAFGLQRTASRDFVGRMVVASVWRKE
ncbi:MAG: class I SAM-dependent methyltransferase [Ferruginibacter sp.]|nr:class I SAM-dependent methyltransferase [Cytophagales bacterium]